MEFGISSPKLFYLFIFGWFALNAFMDYESNAQLIPEDEVEVLKAISSKIEKLNWNVTPRSCNGGGFKNETINEGKPIIERNVTCNCTFSNGTVCHVTHIVMIGLNISGFLPREFGYLIHLQQLDLSNNYLNGSIPRSFARLPLVGLNLWGNPISGPIPKEMGEITTLEELIFRDNLLEGTLPSSLGKLKELRILVLTGNNISGTIPESFANMKKLNHIALDGTNIIGKLPNFIGNWTELSEMYLKGTSMEGPIPTAISQLTKLNRLVISDLHGPPTMRFPNLDNLTSFTALILRNCSIHDSIPNYIGKMENLTILDLSFNKLIGEIPNNISDLINLKFMFLTENSLSGKIPEWILQDKYNYLLV